MERPAAPYLSAIVPLFNEDESVGPLMATVRDALAAAPWSWELILVDDGSTDATADLAAAAAATDPRIRLVELSRNTGQTAAMMAGFDHAQGQVIVTLDGDLQNDPRDIPALVARLEEGFDLVVGWRRDRQDHLLTRKIPSWCANRLIALITGIPIEDNGCSLKAYRRSLLDRLALYSDMHRFIPAFAALAGARIGQMPVRHHPRRFGVSKYGLGRTFRVFADLLTLEMVGRFRERPLLGFGVAAGTAFALSVAFGVAWLIARTNFGVAKASALVFPGAAFILLGLAGYLLMLGLIAEVLVQEYRDVSAGGVPLTKRLQA